MISSCVYEGRVSHSRLEPITHRFGYRLFMMYLDLDELPSLFDRFWLWSVNRRALARFRRRDHIGNPTEPLDQSVRKLVAAETGKAPTGPVRLLTNLSYFGYCFNPVSFYYCFSADGQHVETIVAEVSNTPWGECDTYVLPCDADASTWRFQPKKKMHVSPFMPMDVRYDWALTTPAQRLSVNMGNSKDGKRIFNAVLTLQRSEISSLSLARVLLRFPFMTGRIMLAIYWQALKLWIKRAPIFVHPNTKKKATSS